MKSNLRSHYNTEFFQTSSNVSGFISPSVIQFIFVFNSKRESFNLQRAVTSRCELLVPSLFYTMYYRTSLVRCKIVKAAQRNTTGYSIYVSAISHINKKPDHSHPYITCLLSLQFYSSYGISCMET